MRRIAIALAALCLALAGCAVGNPPSADPAEVTRRSYSHGGQAQITLFTVRGVGKDSGAHTAMLVNGSERVLWDPAGSFLHPHVPEVGDVLHGITPLIERVYIDYHVRPDFYVVRQDKAVTQETADRIIAAMRAHGAAGQATCALSTSGILRQAGLDVGRSWFPNALMRDFGDLAGVTTTRIDTSNVDTNHNVIFGRGGVPLPPGA